MAKCADYDYPYTTREKCSNCGITSPNGFGKAIGRLFLIIIGILLLVFFGR